MPTFRRLLTPALFALAGLAAVPAIAQTKVAVADAAKEQATERASLPHPILMASLDQALGEKGAVQLSPEQSKQVRAVHNAFEQEIKEFLRRHAGSATTGTPDDTIPNRLEAEKRVLAILNKDQLQAVEIALNDAAARRISDRHSHHESHPESKSSDGKTSSSSSSNSDYSSQSSSTHDQHSSSDRHSDSKSSSDKQSKSDKHSSRDANSGKDAESATKKIAWSSLDATEQQAATLRLLDQLSTKDRASLAAELNIRLPEPKQEAK